MMKHDNNCCFGCVLFCSYMLCVYGCVFCSISLLFVYMRVRMPSSPRSIARVPLGRTLPGFPGSAFGSKPFWLHTTKFGSRCWFSVTLKTMHARLFSETYARKLLFGHRCMQAEWPFWRIHATDFWVTDARKVWGKSQMCTTYIPDAGDPSNPLCAPKFEWQKIAHSGRYRALRSGTVRVGIGLTRHVHSGWTQLSHLT